jgi:hypothetical protein
MVLQFGGNTTTGPIVLTDTYNLMYAPSVGTDTYKLAFVVSGEGFTESTTAWILTNGTVLAVDSGGQNSTGTTADDNLLPDSAPFVLVTAYDVAPSSILPASGTVATGQTSLTLGSVTMTVTNYRAETLPLVYSDCFGDTFTYNTFIVQAGTVPQTSFLLLTYLDLQGTQASSGTSQSDSIYLQVTSIVID